MNLEAGFELKKLWNSKFEEDANSILSEKKYLERAAKRLHYKKKTSYESVPDFAKD